MWSIKDLPAVPLIMHQPFIRNQLLCRPQLPQFLLIITSSWDASIVEHNSRHKQSKVLLQAPLLTFGHTLVYRNPRNPSLHPLLPLCERPFADQNSNPRLCPCLANYKAHDTLVHVRMRTLITMHGHHEEATRREELLISSWTAENCSPHLKI